MTISVQLLTTKETLDHCFLPWQLLLRERQHFAWQSPRWWQFWVERSAIGLPYWAVVSSGSRVIGMVPISRSGTKIKSIWSLSLNPLLGGGVIGGQATAVLNAVISQLSNDPKRGSWELDYDPNDDYLKNRFELAFHNARLEPARLEPAGSRTSMASTKLIGWSIEETQPTIVADRQLTRLPIDGEVIWFESAIGCNDVYLTLEERNELLVQLEDGGAEWLLLDEGLYMAFWNFSTSRMLAGEPQVADKNTWLACCLVRDFHGPNRKECARLVAQRLAHNVINSEIQKVLIPDSLDQWMGSTTEVNWPLAFRGYDVQVLRWLLQHRKFHRPTLWRRIQKSISSTATK